MCVFSTPKPPPVAIPEPVEQPPVVQENDEAVQGSRNRERIRRLRQQQENQTAVTGGQGILEPANTSLKSLTGQ